MKKGQGLPITTIVIAALAILVLVILFAITTGRLGIFSGAVSECPGICVSDKIAAKDATAVLRITPKTCKADNFERQIRGTYIAQDKVMDPKKPKNPLVCDTCCVTTLG